MGLDLTWKDEDRKKHGRCRKYLEEIVEFCLPLSQQEKRRTGVVLPEMRRYFVRNDRTLGAVKDLQLPKGGRKKYAIEYLRGSVQIGKEEKAALLRKHYNRFYEELPAREREPIVEEFVQMHFKPGNLDSFGTTFMEGMCIEDGKTTVSVRLFHRWVSREEYEERCNEALQQEDGEDAYTFNRWLVMSGDENNAVCKGCPLSTFTGVKENPVTDQLEKRLRRKGTYGRAKILEGIYKQLVPGRKGRAAQGEYRRLADEKSEFLPGLVNFVLKEMGEFPRLKNHHRKIVQNYGHGGSSRYSCHRGSSYSHFGAFFDYISQFAEFNILSWKYLNSDDGVPRSLVKPMRRELIASRALLEKERVSAVNIYDRRGRFKRKQVNDISCLQGDRHGGYGVGLDGKQEGIALMLYAKGIFDIPIEERQQICDEAGLDGILQQSVLLDQQQERHYFKEITFDHGIYIGWGFGGKFCFLPEVPNRYHPGRHSTPFDGFGNPKEIGKVEYTTAPAMEAFGGLQLVLEKYAKIAGRFDMAVDGC